MVRTNTPRRSNRSTNGKAIADAVGASLASTNGNGKVEAPTAPITTPTAPAVETPKVEAPTTPTPRQVVADAGKLAADALSHEVTRKALLAAVGTVKRADLATDAKLATPRAMERLTRADLKALAKRIDTLADFVVVANTTPTADLVGANIATRMGSVSVATFIAALADASSKADALSMFASK